MKNDKNWKNQFAKKKNDALQNDFILSTSGTHNSLSRLFYIVSYFLCLCCFITNRLNISYVIPVKKNSDDTSLLSNATWAVYSGFTHAYCSMAFPLCIVVTFLIVVLNKNINFGKSHTYIYCIIFYLNAGMFFLFYRNLAFTKMFIWKFKQTIIFAWRIFE